MSKELTSRAENYNQWYNDLVLKGGLADYSAVKGCMVIKPYGYALWENMRDQCPLGKYERPVRQDV